MSDPADHTETLLGTDPQGRREAGPPLERHDPSAAVTRDGAGDGAVWSTAPGQDGASSPSAGTDAPADSGELLEGSRMLGRRYLLEERIASGGMASVWRAHDEVLARTVAVKVLHDHLAEDGAFRERFRREAVTAARLAHPNIVGLYDTGTDGDYVYLVMEFVDGSTLRDVIAEVGTLEIGQVAAIGEKIARALDYAHSRGLVHRDVKPANILIGEGGAVKVADFGIAKADQDQTLTRTGMVLGTAAYVAPEQVLAQPLDGKADQYSLGCVLYEALTGRRPFKGDSPVATAAQRLERDPLPLRSLRANIPRALEQIVARCIERDKKARFSSCGRLADALAQFVGTDMDPVATLAAPSEPTTALPQPTGPAAPMGPTDDDESFLRSEGRWLGPVLALLLLAGAVVGVGLATGKLEAVDGLLPRFARDVTGQAGNLIGDSSATLSIAKATAFDPQGDRQENNGDVGDVHDGDPRTSWRTEGYDTPQFGNLKEGVGFSVDLGARQTIDKVALTTTTPGITYELGVADAPASTLSGWRTVASVPNARPGENITELDQPVPARYLLVWVRSNLQRDGPRFYAGFSELVVEGTPSR